MGISPEFSDEFPLERAISEKLPARAGNFFLNFQFATLSFLSTRKWLVFFRNHQNFNVSVQIASNVTVNSEFDKNWCSFHYIEKWIWQCIILNLTKIWIFLVNLPKKFTLALGQFSNVPRAAGNFRKFPSCAARPRENFRKFPAALGKFQKFPSGSGKFLGKLHFSGKFVKFPWEFYGDFWEEIPRFSGEFLKIPR